MRLPHRVCTVHPDARLAGHPRRFVASFPPSANKLQRVEETMLTEDAFQAHRRTSHFHDIIERQVVPLLDERAWARMEPMRT